MAQEAGDKLITAIQRAHGGLKDDTSVIVLDLLPAGKDFPSIAGASKTSKSRGGFMCCAACVPCSLTCMSCSHSTPSLEKDTLLTGFLVAPMM